jgi:hypothetical protein
VHKHYCNGPRLGHTAYVRCSECSALVCRPNDRQSLAMRPRSYDREAWLEGLTTYDECYRLMRQPNIRSEVLGLGSSDDLLGRMTDAERQPRKAKGVVIAGRFVGLSDPARKAYVLAEIDRSRPKGLVKLGYFYGPNGLRPFHRSLQPIARKVVERPKSDAVKRREARAKDLSLLREAVASAPSTRTNGPVVLGSDLARKLGIVAIGNVE